MRHEVVTTEVVVIFLFSSSLHLIRQLMDVAEIFCIWFQSLAPHGPYKDPHLDDVFGIWMSYGMDLTINFLFSKMF